MVAQPQALIESYAALPDFYQRRGHRHTNHATQWQGCCSGIDLLSDRVIAILRWCYTAIFPAGIMRRRTVCTCWAALAFMEGRNDHAWDLRRV